jgi:hypothetical protein
MGVVVDFVVEATFGRAAYLAKNYSRFKKN